MSLQKCMCCRKVKPLNQYYNSGISSSRLEAKRHSDPNYTPPKRKICKSCNHEVIKHERKINRPVERKFYSDESLAYFNTNQDTMIEFWGEIEDYHYFNND